MYATDYATDYAIVAHELLLYTALTKGERIVMSIELICLKVVR